jgi:hypothetical protein
MQERLSFLPGYDFKGTAAASAGLKQEESWPEPSPGKSLAGVLGAAMTLVFTGVIGLGLRKYCSPGKR